MTGGPSWMRNANDRASRGETATTRFSWSCPAGASKTWLHYLGGQPVDELQRYPRLRRERDCADHAKRQYEMCHAAQRLAESAPPSLREACEEYRKLRQ